MTLSGMGCIQTYDKINNDIDNTCSMLRAQAEAGHFVRGTIPMSLLVTERPLVTSSLRALPRQGSHCYHPIEKLRC